MTRAQNRRQRGTIDQLQSGSFRVRVYSGVDPLTHRRHTLQETAETRAEAEHVRVKLLSQSTSADSHGPRRRSAC
jgi:integrase